MQTRRTARGAVRDRIDAAANGGGVAFFAHVGGFIFGLLTARHLARAGQAAPQEQWRSTA